MLDVSDGSCHVQGKYTHLGPHHPVKGQLGRTKGWAAQPRGHCTSSFEALVRCPEPSLGGTSSFYDCG